MLSSTEDWEVDEEDFLPSSGVAKTFRREVEKSFRLKSGVEKGPFLLLFRGGGNGGGAELLASPFGGRGGLTEGT